MSSNFSFCLQRLKQNNLGQSVYESSVNKQQTSINLNSWTGKGIYMVNLIDGNSNIVESKKIILQ
jgi:hypothetical protein